jgi:hypothetical protein
VGARGVVDAVAAAARAVHRSRPISCVSRRASSSRSSLRLLMAENGCTVPVIFMTALDDEATRREALLNCGQARTSSATDGPGYGSYTTAANCAIRNTVTTKSTATGE